MNIQAASILAALVGSLLTYLAVARKLSGRIATSEAATLWEEARKMREDYVARIGQLNEIVETCQKRIDELERRNDSLYMENVELKRTVEKHEKTIAALRKENTKLHRRVADLEGNK